MTAREDYLRAYRGRDVVVSGEDERRDKVLGRILASVSGFVRVSKFGPLNGTARRMCADGEIEEFDSGLGNAYRIPKEPEG
jgi:hypothetical protein